MSSVATTAPQKQYSRHNVRTSALGAAAFSDVDPCALAEQVSPTSACGTIFDAATDCGINRSEKHQNYLKFLEPVNVGAGQATKIIVGGNQFVESPQDVAAMMSALSPGTTPVKWRQVDSAGEVSGIKEPVSDLDVVSPIVTGSDHVGVDASQSDAQLDVPVDPEGAALIRSVVVANINQDSIEWSTKAWMALVIDTLRITEVTPDLKRVLKGILIEESTDLMSQTQDQTDAFADLACAAAADGNSILHESGNDTTPEVGEFSGSRALEIGSVVNQLISEDSVQWSVKTWNAKVAETLGVPFLLAEDKIVLKELILSAAEMLTQTQDASLDLDLAGEEFACLADLPARGLPPSSAEEADDRSDSSSAAASLSDQEEYGPSGDSGSSKRGRKLGIASSTDTKEKEPLNEELKAIQALEEGLNARAQAVHDLTYRDRDELEQKQAEMRGRVLDRIRSRVNPHLKEINAAALKSLKHIDQAIEKRGMLRDIVKVFVREDALAAAEMAVKSSPSPSDSTILQSAPKEEAFVNLSDDEDDGSSDDESDVAIAAAATRTASNVGKQVGASATVSNGGLHMGFVKPLFGNRNRLKAQLMMRANDNSAARLATKVGVASSQDLTDVLGYTESVRKAHAALKADQLRAAREAEEEEAAQREKRRKEYRERLRKAEDGDSDAEFDENEESYVNPVATAANDVEGENSEDDNSSVAESNSDDEELDEEAQLAELEIRERALAQSELQRLETEETSVTEDDRTAVGNLQAGLIADVIVPSIVSGAFSSHGIDGSVDEATDMNCEGGEITDAGPAIRSVSLKNDSTVEEDVSGAEQEDVEEEEHQVKKSRNSKYLDMLKAETKKKAVPSSVAAFLDEEAEEEEEEGQQRGLLDFGFGKTSDKLDENDEADALKIRKSDLEGIVDDISDDEGDEVEGARRRMEEERKHDRKLQMKILRNLADGYGGRANAGQNGRGHFGIDELTKGDMRSKDAMVDGEAVDDDNAFGDSADFEDDEVLQGKYLSTFTERAKAKRDANVGGEESDISLSDEESVDEEDDGTGERTQEDKLERRLRKEKQTIMMRSWMEKTRIKCALQDDSRKKRRLDVAPPMLMESSALSRSRTLDTDSRGVGGMEQRAMSRSVTLSSGSAGKSHFSILDDLDSLGRSDLSPGSAPRPAVSSSSIVGSISATTASAAAVSKDDVAVSMAAPVGSGASNTPRAVLASNERYSGVGLSAFGAPVLPAALSVVTHQPQIKKSLKRSLADLAKPPAIDTRLSNSSSIGFGGELTPVSDVLVGSSTNSGAPLSVRNSSAAPRSVRNGYNGNLSDGSAAHCMGLAFGDGSMSCAPEPGGVSLPGFSDSQGIMARRMSFRTAATVSVGASFRGPSPSSAVTVAGQGFAFSVSDSHSRSGIGSESNAAFFGGENSLLGNSCSGAPANDLSMGAPPLKRVRSQGSGSVSLLGIGGKGSGTEGAMRRQSSTSSLQAIGRLSSEGIRKSVQESIGGSGKNVKSGLKSGRRH